MSEQLQNNPHQPLIDAYNQYGVAMQSAIEDQAEKVEQGFVQGTEDGKMLQTGHVASLADDVMHGKSQQEVTSMDNEIAATKAKLENPFLRSEERAKLKADLKDYKALKKVAKSEHQETVDAFRDLLSAEAQAKVQEDVDSRIYDEFWGDNVAPKTDLRQKDELDVPSWVNGKKAAELPSREVGATLDGTEGTRSYADEKAKIEAVSEPSREERLEALAHRQAELQDEYAEALSRGQEGRADIERIIEQHNVVRSQYLELKFEDVSDEDLEQQLGQLTGEDDTVEHNEVRDEMQRRIEVRRTEAGATETPESEATQEQPQTPEEEEVVRGGIRGRWNRIRKGLQGYSLGNARTNVQFASAWLQSRRSGRSANQETEGAREQSPIRRAAPYVGAAAAGAALVAGVWLQNKGYINVLPHYNGNTDSWVFNELFDLNPFNGHTLAHDLGTQEFADFMSKVNELKDSGLTDAQIGEMLDNLAKSKS